MSPTPEITVPQTKPATEWINGRALQKVSPQERHARAQGAIVSAMREWAHRTGAGRVGTEWEFRVTPPHEATRPLVPDVAFLSYDRLSYDDDSAAQIPYMAPDVAIEVLSPDDRRRDVAEKIRVYLAAGAKLVVLVDSERRTMTSYDAEGFNGFEGDETFNHPALPGFEVVVGKIFEKPQPRP
ncbi:MAG: Uma2 family endonuclease [Candidatus Eremiobacteraeota bacterium]|nr:Uma2 family endonuclease [Candidatus Eremiobacteraeota bacterium]